MNALKPLVLELITAGIAQELPDDEIERRIAHFTLSANMPRALWLMELHDTYGLPFDLIAIKLREKGEDASEDSVKSVVQCARDFVSECRAQGDDQYWRDLLAGAKAKGNAADVFQKKFSEHLLGVHQRLSSFGAA